MNFLKLYNFLFEQVVYEDLVVKKDKLSSPYSQKILHKFVEDLPLFQQMIEKRTSDKSIPCNLYFYNNEFIGYSLLSYNKFSFDNEKNLTDLKSSYKTLNIDDIEIRDSVRKNKNNPRFGKIIIDNIINSSSNNFDGITLQANNDELLTRIYPKYGFVDLKVPGNIMVKWF